MFLSRTPRSTTAVLGLAALAALLGLTTAPAAAQTPQAYEFPQIAPDTRGFSRMLAMLAAQQQQRGAPAPNFVNSIAYRNYVWYNHPAEVVLPPTDATYAWRSRPVEPAPAVLPPLDRTYAWYAPPGTTNTNGVAQFDNNWTPYVRISPEQSEAHYVAIVGPDGRTRTFRLDGPVTTGPSAPVYVRSRTR